MIVEALQHLFIKAPKHIKEMGYLKESIAIEARAKRCGESWTPHLAACKKQILMATTNLAPESEIMVLGSGGFHDVPIEVLLEFNITCVDIVHLPKIIKKYPTVSFIDKDVTGVVEPLYKAVKNESTLFCKPDWSLAKKPGLIISLNILSQLALRPLHYAEMHKYDLGTHFHENIQTSHVNWLKKQDTNILMISDISREYYQDEQLLESVPSLPNLALDKPDEIWQWNIAPLGEVDKEISVRHTVGVWRI